MSNGLLGISISHLHRILTIHLPKPLSIYRRLDRFQSSIYVQAFYKYFVTC
jgi:hypothetical protein